jgi:hypothetical protein
LAGQTRSGKRRKNQILASGEHKPSTPEENEADEYRDAMVKMVKNAGKKVVDGRTKKNMFKFNKKGKLTKGEKNEIKRTSKNIFDWFSSKDNSRVDEDMEISTIIKKDITEDNDELGSVSGDVLLHAEGHLDTPGGVKSRTPRLE